MKLFIASSLCWAYHPIEVITIAKETGLQGVELWVEHFSYHQANADEVKYAAEKENIELTVHGASWDLNICSQNKGIQVQSIVELKKSINLAASLGARHMTFQPGKLSIGNYLVEEYKRTLVMNTRKLLDYAKEKSVTLSIELMEPLDTEILCNADAMNEFLDEIGNELYTTMDVSHIPLGDSSICYFKKLKRVNSIHLSDSRGGCQHLPLGEGEIDFQPIFRFFENMELPLVLEGIDTERSLFFLKEHLTYLNKYDFRRRAII